MEPENYVHRIGRTGRAGHGGIAITFCQADEVPYLRRIEKTIDKQIPVREDNPYPMQEKPHEGKPSRGRSRSRRGGRSRRNLNNNKPQNIETAGEQPAEQAKENNRSRRPRRRRKKPAAAPEA